MSINLFQAEIQDPYSRDNFRTIQTFTRDNTLLSLTYKRLEIDIKNGDTQIKHGFNFIPKDIFIVYISSDTATVRIKHSLSTREHIVINSNEACKIRVFVGK